MTTTAVSPVRPDLDRLTALTAAAGLVVGGSAAWPESDVDTEVPVLAGFVESSFSPLVAAVAERALDRDPAGRPGAAADSSTVDVVAVVLATAAGDVTSAVHVARAVDAGQRVRPLLFFQSVPNAVAGYVAARWRLCGPVVCVADPAVAVDIATALIEDGDTDRALVVWAEVAEDADHDRAAAVVVSPGPALAGEAPAGSPGEAPAAPAGDNPAGTGSRS